MVKGVNNLIRTISGDHIVDDAYAWLCAKLWTSHLNKGFTFLGYHISSCDIRVVVQTFKRIKTRRHRLYEQGTFVIMLGEMCKSWIKWMCYGVSLNIKKLLLKTTEILQNTFNFRLPMQSS